ncbi:MAG: FecR domain-containing protein, partial [Proteobacteria bacterium]|nr:FecR domain-containing protein [Pseudomonadota bacterium]
MIFFVILPFFLIASNHMQKNLPGHDCTVTDVSGQAFVQYQVTHLLVQQPQKSPSYTKTSQWIPLKKGADIGFGALIKTEKNAFVDIMMQNAAAFRIKEKSLVTLVQDPQKPKTIELALNEGKILSRVIGKKSSQSEKGEGIYRVKTPTATVRVHGTTFSV